MTTHKHIDSMPAYGPWLCLDYVSAILMPYLR